ELGQPVEVAADRAYASLQPIHRLTKALAARAVLLPQVLRVQGHAGERLSQIMTDRCEDTRLRRVRLRCLPSHRIRPGSGCRQLAGAPKEGSLPAFDFYGKNPPNKIGRDQVYRKRQNMIITLKLHTHQR